MTAARLELGLALQDIRAPMVAVRLRCDLRAKMLQHLLGVVARRLRFDHGGSPGAASPASSTADFSCADATGGS